MKTKTPPPAPVEKPDTPAPTPAVDTKTTTHRDLFHAWQDAAEKHWQMRSDATEAACRAARAAWYMAVYGKVTPCGGEED